MIIQDDGIFLKFRKDCLVFSLNNLVMKKTLHFIEKIQNREIVMNLFMMSVVVLFSGLLFSYLEIWFASTLTVVGLVLTFLFAFVKYLNTDWCLDQLEKFYIRPVVVKAQKTFVAKDAEKWNRLNASAHGLDKPVIELASLWSRLMQAEMDQRGLTSPDKKVVYSCWSAACDRMQAWDLRYYAVNVVVNHWAYGDKVREALL